MAETFADEAAGSEAGRDLSLRLAVFEGPLDLLLHLIRTSELDIYDIPILEITRQYDEYLSLMQELDLQIAGEYLVMAATLLHIKSKMLLPKPPAGAEGAEEDPRADLVRQLVEYEKLKAAAETLRGLEEARGDVYHRGADPLAAFEGESLLSVSLFDLLAAFRGVMETYAATRAVEIEREEFSIADKQEWILAELRQRGSQSFQDLLRSLPSRAERVVAFLALLELIRLTKIHAAQRRVTGEILLMISGGEESRA